MAATGTSMAFAKDQEEKRTDLEARVSELDRYIQKVSGKINNLMAFAEEIDALKKEQEKVKQTLEELKAKIPVGGGDLDSQVTQIFNDLDALNEETDRLAERSMRRGRGSGSEVKELKKDKEYVRDWLNQLPFPLPEPGYGNMENPMPTLISEGEESEEENEQPAVDVGTSGVKQRFLAKIAFDSSDNDDVEEGGGKKREAAGDVDKKKKKVMTESQKGSESEELEDLGSDLCTNIEGLEEELSAAMREEERKKD